MGNKCTDPRPRQQAMPTFSFVAKFSYFILKALRNRSVDISCVRQTWIIHNWPINISILTLINKPQELAQGGAIKGNHFSFISREVYILHELLLTKYFSNFPGEIHQL